MKGLSLSFYTMHNLMSVWPEFTERYEASRASLATYHQKYQVFLKWLNSKNKESEKKIFSLEDVTRETAEDYARYIFKRKSTARKDIDSLRRLWEVMLPDLERNPWKIGLHLRPKPLAKPCNYRPLSLDEARRLISSALLCAERASDEDNAGVHKHDARFTTSSDKFHDIADAAVFAWHYGMRMGSLVALNWRELSTWKKGFFLHVPPKTRFMKPWPLEIPVVREVANILKARAEALRTNKNRRYPSSAPLFPALAEEYARSQSNLSVSIKCIFKRAGIFDTHKGRAQMHSFRASFITQMDEAGAPSGITDSITGHAPRTIHDCYSHARPQALRRWLDKAIPPLFI